MRHDDLKGSVGMNRTIKIASGALIVGVALICLGYGACHLRPCSATLRCPIPAADSRWSVTACRWRSTSPLGADGVLREGQFADVQFRITDKASGQPLSGVAPGAWLDPQTLPPTRPRAANRAARRGSGCSSSRASAPALLDLNSYFLLVMNRDASLSVVDPSVSVGGMTSTLARIDLKQPPMDWVTPGTTSGCSCRCRRRVKSR
jgi:hypothetical protein